MDEPVEEPTPPSNLPDEVVKAATSMSPLQLRQLIEFAQSRLQFTEMSISDLIEPQEDEEIVRMKDYGYYTVVIKRKKATSDHNPAEPPHAYVVTLEPEPEGGHHIHWEDLGQVIE